jgi:hypothetical protein
MAPFYFVAPFAALHTYLKTWTCRTACGIGGITHGWHFMRFIAIHGFVTIFTIRFINPIASTCITAGIRVKVAIGWYKVLLTENWIFISIFTPLISLAISQ